MLDTIARGRRERREVFHFDLIVRRNYFIESGRASVACDKNGIPSFDRVRYRRHDGRVFLYAFDLIELDGDDLRREPLVVRKATLSSVLASSPKCYSLRSQEPSPRLRRTAVKPKPPPPKPPKPPPPPPAP